MVEHPNGNVEGLMRRLGRRLLYPSTLVAIVILVTTLVCAGYVLDWFGIGKRTPEPPAKSSSVNLQPPSHQDPEEMKLQASLAERVRQAKAREAVYGCVRSATRAGVEEPVSGAVISIARCGDYAKEDVDGFSVPKDGIAVVNTSTDGAGYFFVTDVVPGDYMIDVRSPEGKNLASRKVKVTLERGQLLRQDFSLAMGSLLTGLVVWEDGITPVPGATITARTLRPGLEWVRQCSTKDDGRFSLPAGDALPCEVMAEAPSGENSIAARVDVEAGPEPTKVAKVTIAIKGAPKQGRALFVRLTAPSGEGLAGVSFAMRKEGAKEVFKECISGPTGGTLIEGLGTGSYSLDLQPNAKWQVENNLPVKVEILGNEPTATQRIELKLLPKADSAVPPQPAMPSSEVSKRDGKGSEAVK